jgi:hypothetical protein
MIGAGQALAEAALAALGGVDGLNGVYDGPPLTAAFPFARVEERMAALAPDLVGWRLVSLVFLRGSMLQDSGAAWTAAIEYRARLLKA